MSKRMVDPESLFGLGDKRDALDNFREKYQEKERAKSEYSAALKKCIDAGVPNTAMAAVTGISETAIRMWRKRHNI